MITPMGPGFLIFFQNEDDISTGYGESQDTAYSRDFAEEIAKEAELREIIEETLNLAPQEIEEVIEEIKTEGVRLDDERIRRLAQSIHTNPAKVSRALQLIEQKTQEIEQPPKYVGEAIIIIMLLAQL